MKKQLLNFGVAFAAMMLMAGNSFAQLTDPVLNKECPAIDESVMVIDGFADEADYSAPIAIENIFTEPDGGWAEADLSGTFQVCWNNVGVYIFFKVKDDIEGLWDGDGANNPWTYDNVEIFFNYDTTNVYKSGSYAPDGVQLRYNRGVDNVNGGVGFGNGEPSKAWYDTVPDQFKQISNAGEWQVEVLVPWLYILADSTKPEDILDSIAAHKNAFGFDVSLGDNDTGVKDARDCQASWDPDKAIGDADADNAWQDVRKFGILSLTGTPITSVRKVTDSKFDIYPNPVNNVLHFNNLNNVIDITIVNALGQTVKVVDVTTNSVALPVSDLAMGTYIAIIRSENETYTSKFVKK